MDRQHGTFLLAVGISVLVSTFCCAAILALGGKGFISARPRSTRSAHHQRRTKGKYHNEGICDLQAYLQRVFGMATHHG